MRVAKWTTLRALGVALDAYLYNVFCFSELTLLMQFHEPPPPKQQQNIKHLKNTATMQRSGLRLSGAIFRFLVCGRHPRSGIPTKYRTATGLPISPGPIGLGSVASQIQGPAHVSSPFFFFL